MAIINIKRIKNKNLREFDRIFLFFICLGSTGGGGSIDVKSFVGHE